MKFCLLYLNLGDGSSYDIPDKWGNWEKQCYVASAATLDGAGHLVITATDYGTGSTVGPCLNPGRNNGDPVSGFKYLNLFLV